MDFACNETQKMITMIPSMLTGIKTKVHCKDIQDAHMCNRSSRIYYLGILRKTTGVLGMYQLTLQHVSSPWNFQLSMAPWIPCSY